MAFDRIAAGSDADGEKAGEEPTGRRRPSPPDRPGVEGFASRADSRHGAAAANATERQEPGAQATTDRPDDARRSENKADATDDQAPDAQETRRDNTRATPTVDGPGNTTRRYQVDYPIDQSVRDDRGSESEIPKFSPEQLSRLRETENAIRGIAERYGVSVDYTSHPIDPANAVELNKAIARMAREYPVVFRQVGNIKTLDSHSMAEHGSGANTLGHVIHDGQRPVGGRPIEPGIYLSQSCFADKGWLDRNAARNRATGFSVSGTAEGTLYHEFGHAIDNQLRKNPEARTELARELKGAGVSVDPDSLSWAVPPGRRPIEAGLSRYGGRNPREMVAEGFSEWKLESHPRPIARAIGTVIDKHFREG